MTANRKLAELRGIDEATCLEIDKIHEGTDKYIKDAIDYSYPEACVKVSLQETDFLLQELWAFPEDKAMHTLYKKYLFKKQWYGKKYKCNGTGEEFTIPFDVYETACYYFGAAMVDVGRLDAYCRFSNCVEVKDVDEGATTV